MSCQCSPPGLSAFARSATMADAVKLEEPEGMSMDVLQQQLDAIQKLIKTKSEHGIEVKSEQVEEACGSSTVPLPSTGNLQAQAPTVPSASTGNLQAQAPTVPSPSTGDLQAHAPTVPSPSTGDLQAHAPSGDASENLADADMQQRGMLPVNPDKPATAPLQLPDGMVAKEFENKQARSAAWAKYLRSLESGPSKPAVAESSTRTKRSGKIPEDIKMQLAGAHERAYYFQVWLQCEQKWGNVELFAHQYVERVFGKKKTQAWLTHGQLFKIYQDNEVVSAMKQQCAADNTVTQPLVRPHPRIPTVAAATQYKVTIEDQEVETVQNVLKFGLKLSATLDGNDPGDAALVRQHVASAREQFTMSLHDPSGTLAKEPSTPLSLPGSGHSSTPIAARPSPLSNDAGEDEEDPDSKKRRLRREAFEEQEAKRQKRAEEARQKRDEAQEQRRVDRETEKEKRKMLTQTPEGRARVWLAGLQDIISKADAEAQHCDSKCCVLPDGIRAEYASQWKGRSSGFKRLRTQIENVLNGKREANNSKCLVEKGEHDVHPVISPKRLSIYLFVVFQKHM